LPRNIVDCTRWLRGDGESDAAEFLDFESGDSRGDTARRTALRLPAGSGTYIVGQAFADIDGASLSELDVASFFGEGVVAKFNFAGAGMVTEEHLQTGVGQLVRSGDILLLANLGDREGAPQLSAGATQWIINQGIKLVGFDESFAIERRGSQANHRRLLGAGIGVIHNLINLDRTSGRRVAVMALPLALLGTASAPCRVVVID
jgi:kynurenine formamidase